MKELNLLLLAPHWRVSLIRSFQTAKVRLRVAGKLVGADSDPLSPSLKVVDVEYPLPLFADAACKQALLDICERETIHTILPMTNKAVEFLNRHCQDFKRENILAYLQDADTIEVCHDKLKLSKFFNAEKILSPLTGEVGLFINSSEFPLIAKPRQGEGGKDNFVIENQRDLKFYAEKYPGHIMQKYIEGQEFTVDWFSDKSGKPLLIVPRERLAVQGGEVMVSRICMDPEIIAAVRQVGLLLKLKGPANLQGIRPANGKLLFTDINLRFGSGAGHTIAAGGDMPGCIYRDLGDEGPLAEINSIQDGSVMTRFHDAFFSHTGLDEEQR
ncbi:MAG: ATP-grasp domain-containing protein [Nitrospinae bacterium]|jgi:carbamoyl-phosphate synthase large subunit|nr:ATP-grasp domain-containing protein [Nitrospinota bacterium]MDA1109154.1 ATP-grasp domain-containing protein [Nitrospinota bacterium]